MSCKLKVFFFRNCDSFFKSPNLQKKIFQKNYPQLEIWICCLLLLVGNLNFKFRIVFGIYIFFLKIGRFGKHITLSEKKPPLVALLNGRENSKKITTTGSWQYYKHVKLALSALLTWKMVHSFWINFCPKKPPTIKTWNFVLNLKKSNSDDNFRTKIGSNNKVHLPSQYLISRDLAFNNYINGANVPWVFFIWI